MSLITKGLMLLAFFSLVTGVMMLMLSISPQMPAGIHTGFQYVVDGSYWANRYLPIDTGITIYAAYLITEFAIWLFKNLVKVIGYAARLFS